MTVTEEREYVVEALTAGTAENLIESEPDTHPFRVTERDVSYLAAYPIKNPQGDE